MAEASNMLAAATDTLCSQLANAGACWGSSKDDIGRTFFNGDDKTPGFGKSRDAFLDDLADMVNLLRATGGLLKLSGHTYSVADEASTAGSALPKGADKDAVAAVNPYHRPPVSQTLVKSDPCPPFQLLDFLSKLLQEMLGGCQWPDGSLSELASMRDAFYTVADSIGSVADMVVGHANKVTANNSGEAAQKFASFAAALHGGGEAGGLLWLASWSGGLGDSVDTLIKQLKAARLQFELSFEFMAATWVAAWMTSFFTGPAAEGAALVATEETGSALNAFMRAAGKAALMGAGYGGALDGISQYAHIHEGVQKGWNFAELGKAMGEGAIAGGVMGLGGTAVARGSGGLATTLSSWMESGGLKGAATTFAFSGTTGTLGNIVAQAFVEQHVDVGQAAEFGFGMAGIEAARPSGRHSADRIGNAYRLHTWAGEHADSLPPAGGAHDGAPAPETSSRRPSPTGEGGESGDQATSPDPGGRLPRNDPPGDDAPPAGRANDVRLASAPTETAAYTDAVNAPHGTNNEAIKAPTTTAASGTEAPPIVVGSGTHAGDAISGAADPARQPTPPSNRPSIADILNRESPTSSPRGSAAADTPTGPGSVGRRPPEVQSEPDGTGLVHDTSTQRDPQPGRTGETLSAAQPDQAHGPQAPGLSAAPPTTAPTTTAPTTTGAVPVHDPAHGTEPTPPLVIPADHRPGSPTSHAGTAGGDHAVSSGGPRETAVASPADHHSAAPGPRPDGHTGADRATPREVHEARSGDLNSDTRPPLIPAHGERALAVLRGADANTLTGGEALHGSQWAHLRDSGTATQAARERYPYENASTVEVRRLGLTAPDGTERTVTEFTVTVRLHADQALTPHDVVRAKSNILDAADLYYNHQHRLPDGSQLHVRVEFEDIPRSEAEDVPRSEAEGAVQLHPGTGTREGERPDMLTWYADMDPVVIAHELGHHLDMRNEYPDSGHDGAETLTTPDVRRDASVMGSGERYWSDHSLVVDHNGNSVPAVVGLRDRHLGELNAFADRAAPDAPSAHGDAGARVSAERPARPDHQDRSLDLPDHVQELRDRTDVNGRSTFPAEGRDPVEHAILLDRMHALFGDEARTTDHLRYTEALSDAARRLYDTAPDYSFRAEDLQGLRHLADVAGASPHGRPPHADALREVARQTLDRTPAPHDIEGLSKLAAHLNDQMGGRHALERPSDALHRAAADKLGTLPSTEVTYRAIDKIAEDQRSVPDRSGEHEAPAADRKDKAKQKAVREATMMRGRALTFAEQREIEQAVEQQWRDSSGTLHRPSLRDKTIRGILENRDSQGNLLDANTGNPIPQGRADIGHKPGDEWRRVRDEAKRMGLTQEQLNSIVQDPGMYQWEDRNQNRGHQHEDRSAGGTSKRLQRAKKHRDGSVTIDGQRIYSDGSTYDEKTGIKVNSSDVPDVFARRQWQAEMEGSSQLSSHDKRALQAQKKADDLTKRIGTQWGKDAKKIMRDKAEKAQADADKLREEAEKRRGRR